MAQEALQLGKCPRCSHQKRKNEHCANCGLKPSHSKDGRLQLCFRCNRYCGHTRNICPRCDK